MCSWRFFTHMSSFSVKNSKLSLTSIRQLPSIPTWNKGKWLLLGATETIVNQFALVLWCGHCSVSFQSFVSYHLVIATVRKTKIAPGKWERSACRLITRKCDVCYRFINSILFLLDTKIKKSCLISPSRMVSFSSFPDDEMYLQPCNQRTVKILVELTQINYAVYVVVQFYSQFKFYFLCFWVWYVHVGYRNLSK